VIAETAGLFVSPLQVGRWVRAGEVVGQVFDGFDGELRAEIRAPLTGLLSGLRRQPLLYEGDLVARLQSSSRTADAADTFLPAQGQ
jgi:predicted deacylase